MSMSRYLPQPQSVENSSILQRKLGVPTKTRCYRWMYLFKIIYLIMATSRNNHIHDFTHTNRTTRKISCPSNPHIYIRYTLHTIESHTHEGSQVAAKINYSKLQYNRNSSKIQQIKKFPSKVFIKYTGPF